MFHVVDATNLSIFKAKKYFVGSVFVHIIVINLLFFQKKINHFFWEESQPKQVSEIIKVDVVGLPKLTLKELEQLKRAIDNKEEESSPDVNVQNVAQDEVTESIKDVSELEEELPDSEKNVDSLENDTEGAGLSLIEKLSKQSGAKFKKGAKSKRKAKKNSIGVKKLKNLLLEGNQISKGSSIKGRYQGDLAQFDQYVLALPNLIRPFWKLPTFLRDGAFQARIIIYINSEGRVIHYRFVSKSGNEEFDSRAVKSINKSQPFPLPSEEIKDRLLSEGVILGFPL